MQYILWQLSMKCLIILKVIGNFFLIKTYIFSMPFVYIFFSFFFHYPFYISFLYSSYCFIFWASFFTSPILAQFISFFILISYITIIQAYLHIKSCLLHSFLNFIQTLLMISPVLWPSYFLGCNSNCWNQMFWIFL